MKHLIWVFCVLTLISCQKDQAEPVELPSALAYTPNSLQMMQGTTKSSATPSIKGTAPITYSLTSSPANSGITINAQGVIEVANTVTANTYNISVTATNSGGSTKFDNVYTVVVTPPVFPASNLAYSPNTLTITEGNTGTSASPTVSGTAPFTFAVSSAPASNAISINNQGVISVANTIAKGTYTLSVSATNAGGTTNFANIYTVTVNAAPIAPANLTYVPASLSITQGNTSNSSTPSVQGTAPITFSVSTSPTNNAITINAQGVINVANTSPAGTFLVSVQASNSVGNTTFTNVYTVTVNAPTTFNTDIQPLIASKCTPCHVAGGSQQNFTVYNNAKTKITSILDRIQRAQGSAGAMPQGGPALSTAEINLIKKWQTDGLKEQ